MCIWVLLVDNLIFKSFQICEFGKLNVRYAHDSLVLKSLQTFCGDGNGVSMCWGQPEQYDIFLTENAANPLALVHRS